MSASFQALVGRRRVVWLYQPVYEDDDAYREALKLPPPRGRVLSTIEMSRGNPNFWLKRG